MIIKKKRKQYREWYALKMLFVSFFAYDITYNDTPKLNVTQTECPLPNVYVIARG